MSKDIETKTLQGIFNLYSDITGVPLPKSYSNDEIKTFMYTTSNGRYGENREDTIYLADLLMYLRNDEVRALLNEAIDISKLKEKPIGKEDTVIDNSKKIGEILSTKDKEKLKIVNKQRALVRLECRLKGFNDTVVDRNFNHLGGAIPQILITKKIAEFDINRHLNNDEHMYNMDRLINFVINLLMTEGFYKSAKPESEIPPKQAQ